MSLAFSPTRIPPSRGDANGKRLLTAREPLGETPALHAIRPDPQLRPATIGKLDNSDAGPGRADCPDRKAGYRRSDLSAATEYQQFSRTPTKRPRRHRTLISTLTYCFIDRFIDVSGCCRTAIWCPWPDFEPALLAELDFEFERVYQFRHRGLSGLKTGERGG